MNVQATQLNLSSQMFFNAMLMQDLLTQMIRFTCAYSDVLNTMLRKYKISLENAKITFRFCTDAFS